MLGFSAHLEDTSEDYALAMQLQYEEERQYQIDHAKDSSGSKCEYSIHRLIQDKTESPKTYGVIPLSDLSPSLHFDEEDTRHYVGVNSHYGGRTNDKNVVLPTVPTLNSCHLENHQTRQILCRQGEHIHSHNLSRLTPECSSATRN